MEQEKIQMMYTEAQHEKEMTRIETSNKRWFILCIILLLVLVGSNAGWIIYESQFQDVVVTQENDKAPNNYIGNDGEIVYGQTDNQSQNP